MARVAFATACVAFATVRSMFATSCSHIATVKATIATALAELATTLPQIATAVNYQTTLTLQDPTTSYIRYDQHNDRKAILLLAKHLPAHI